MRTTLGLEGDAFVPVEVARSTVAVEAAASDTIRAHEGREHAGTPSLLTGAADLVSDQQMLESLRARSERVQRRARQFARRRA